MVCGSDLHAAIASSMNQTVKLPRRLNAALYSGRFVPDGEALECDDGGRRGV